MTLLKIKIRGLICHVTVNNETKSIQINDIPQAVVHVKEWLKGFTDIEAGVVDALPLIEKACLTYLTETFNLPFFIRNDAMSLDEQIEEAKYHHQWELFYNIYPKGKEEYSIESLLTVGNGYLALRGTTPEMTMSHSHYPGTYLAGLYNEAVSEVEGHQIVNEDFVNAPNMQKMYLVIEGETIDIETNDVIMMERTLSLKTGEFIADYQIELEDKGVVTIQAKKFVSMSQRHLYGIHYAFHLDFEAREVLFVSEADGTVENKNVERYGQLTSHHLRPTYQKAEGASACYIAETKASKISIFQQSELRSQTVPLEQLQNNVSEMTISQVVRFVPQKNKWYEVEKMVFVEKGSDKKEWMGEQPYSYQTELGSSQKEWLRLWNEAGIVVEGDMRSQKMLNLHTYHMLVSGSPVGNKELDASVTARGLHGEAYRGHIFWDELFILPFYVRHFPDTAKQLLMYRYERLDMAKTLATVEGHSGAMYPWQSGLDGSEQSQKRHINPLTGEWKEDHSHRQRHVSLAIAYNIWYYTHVTGDEMFMNEYGKEMLVEIIRFWLDLAHFNEQTQRYDISGVMGPDEFHEAYPEAMTGGLTNNAYTNLMVSWLGTILLEMRDRQEVTHELRLDEWEKIVALTEKLALEINEDGVLAQYEGYFDLEEIDWEYYRSTYKNVYRMDRILHAEGLSADAFKVAKQADTLQLFYNLPMNQVTQLIETLGYQLPKDYVETNLDYYLARTSHGSTLSRVVHSQLAEMNDKKELAWQLYQEALSSDYDDIQGGTTAEGIHTGVMSSTLTLTLTAFAGLDVRGNLLRLAPDLPTGWETLSFMTQWRGTKLEVSIYRDFMTVKTDGPLDMLVYDQSYTLLKDSVTRIELGGALR